MQNSLLWVVIVVVILVGGFLLWQSMTPAPSTTPTPTPTPTTLTPTPTPTPGAGTGAPMIAAVAYNAEDGFYPAEVTIKRGGTVSWTNTGSSDLWVASGPHPVHTGYSGTALAQHCPDPSGTAFDQCANGATYTFKFDKVGTWPYHNHSASTKFGRVIVVE